MTQAEQVIRELEAVAQPELAAHSQRFFKTGKGEYAEGDLFLGMKTPVMKEIAKKYKTLPLQEIETLLHSKYHEARSLALSVLTMQYPKADSAKKQEIVDLYLRSREQINNWDLVDISAYKILGAHILETGDSSILYELADCGHLWSERISVISCCAMIKKGDFKDIQKLAIHFLSHKHDLMHKAVGWMLREAGKKEEAFLLGFLEKHADKMPRTMLRYSIEKLTPEQKKYYMSK